MYCFKTAVIPVRNLDLCVRLSYSFKTVTVIGVVSRDHKTRATIFKAVSKQ